MKPRVLVIAGSDSSGGAGVDADREACIACGVEPLEVVTAWTEQDDGGVRSLGVVEPSVWLAQARRALEDISALKFGLLPGLDALRAAAELVAELRGGGSPDRPIVLDPILASSSGHSFLDTEAREALLELLLPHGLIWTPNLPEAAQLTDRDPAALVGDVAERVVAARELLARGARAVVLKGGHGGEDPVLDLVIEERGEPAWLDHERIPGAGIRGSGCRFASALTAYLASGAGLELAATQAGGYVLERIRQGN